MNILENIPNEASQKGLTKEAILNDVEIKLRTAGMEVISDDVFNNAKHAEKIKVMSLQVYVHIVPAMENSIFVYDIDVSGLQNGFLERDELIAGSFITWQTGYFGIITSDHVIEVRNKIIDQIDIFLNAYLSVNPKK